MAADYKTVPVKSWKAVRTLEKGLLHHYSTNRNIRMQKKDGTEANSDQENAKVSTEHFEKLFNNTSPLPCDKTALEELFDVPEFLQLTIPPTMQEIKDALKGMANNKTPGPSHITQDTPKAMIWEETKFQSSCENDDEDSKYIAEYFHNILTSFWDGDTSIN
eukprot:5353364-Ditylum_brightwellii.AAC.1